MSMKSIVTLTLVGAGEDLRRARPRQARRLTRTNHQLSAKAFRSCLFATASSHGNGGLFETLMADG
jgi:hypothetical protein